MTTASASARGKAQPLAIGPTWTKNPDGSWLLPKWTLGWDAIAWSAETLLQPDGPDAGKPWKWTLEQARLLLWWYAVDQHGRFVYRRGVLRRLKGWGKDPFGAGICGIEFAGPCRFGGWRDGQPIAVPHPAPWIQIAAVSLEQTKNTMTLFPGLFGGKDRAKALGIDLGKEIIYGPGSARIEAVTSSPRALEGARSSFVLKNETHHWLSNNDGHEMSRVIARNQAKSRDGAARSLAITNAHEPGEDSVAEHDWDAWQKIHAGKSKATGFLYDSLEAPPGTRLTNQVDLRKGLVAARGDSEWLDVDRLVEEILDPATPVSMSRRFYLNQIVASEDSYLAPAEWAKRADSKAKLAAGETVVMFGDGSSTDDHTGLIACRLSDGMLFVLGHWDPSQSNGEINRDEVDGAVGRAFTELDVVAFYFDLEGWESYVDKWRDDFGSQLLVNAGTKAGKNAHAIAWDMRGRQAEFSGAVKRFHADVVDKDGAPMHDGNKALAQHIANAKRAGNRWGYSIRKEHRESARKIDLAVCAIGARMARNDVINSGVMTKRKRRGKGRVAGF